MTNSGVYVGKHEPWHQKLEAFTYSVCHLPEFTSLLARRRCRRVRSQLLAFAEPLTQFVLQARGGSGEVSRSAPPPSADLSGQANHQQRDGAGEDEESRATDAAAKPFSGETSDMRRAPPPHRQTDCGVILIRHRLRTARTARVCVNNVMCL